MFYGFSRNTGHGSHRTAYRYTWNATRSAAWNRDWNEKERWGAFEEWLLRNDRGDVGLAKLGVVMAGAVVAAGPILLGWGLCRLVRWLSRASRSDGAAALRHHLSMQRRLRRSNRIGRHPPPSAERLLEQWNSSRNSLEDKMILGAMLGDLEAAVDNSYIRDERGEIIGRKAGIRGWLADNCPALYNRYKTLMRYKAMADKMRVFAEDGGCAEASASALPPSSARHPGAAAVETISWRSSASSCEADAADPERQPTSNSTVDAAAVPDPDALVDVLLEALLGPGPATTRGSANGDAADRVRSLLAQCRTLAALDDALWSALGLVRTRRRPRRRAA